MPFPIMVLKNSSGDDFLVTWFGSCDQLLQKAYCTSWPTGDSILIHIHAFLSTKKVENGDLSGHLSKLISVLMLWYRSSFWWHGFLTAIIMKYAFSDVGTLYNSAVRAGSYMKINHETGYPSWIILRLSAEQLPTRRIASLCNVSRR